MAHQYLEDHLAAIRGALEELVPIGKALKESTDTLSDLTRELLAERRAEPTPAPAPKKPAKKKAASKKPEPKPEPKPAPEPEPEPEEQDEPEAKQPQPAGPTLNELKKRVLEMIGAGGGEDLTKFREKHDIHALGKLQDGDPALVKLDKFLHEWFASHLDD